MVHELTIIDKIWCIILEVITTVAELTSFDYEILLELIIRDNSRLAAFKILAQSA